jgi:hypothetical protein
LFSSVLPAVVCGVINVTHVCLLMANCLRKWMRNNIASLTFWHYQSNRDNNHVVFW